MSVGQGVFAIFAFIIVVYLLLCFAGWLLPGPVTDNHTTQSVQSEIELAEVLKQARNVFVTFDGGFVICEHCGEQESMTDCDFVQALGHALKAYDARS